MVGNNVTVSDTGDSIVLNTVLNNPPVRQLDLSDKDSAKTDTSNVIVEKNMTDSETCDDTAKNSLGQDNPTVEANIDVECENMHAYTDDKHETEPGDETLITENIIIELEGTCDNIARWKEILAEMPVVLERLTLQGKLADFENYVSVVCQDQLPPDNIAYILFLDVVRWFRRRNSGMRYNPVSVRFWRNTYKMFHEKALSWFGGWKAGLTNFAVPNVSQLNRLAAKTPFKKQEIKPGILHGMLKAFAQAKPDAACKLSVDGKE